MNGTIDADALLPQIVSERKAEIALLSEQYRDKKPPSWLKDDESRAAIWVPSQGKISIDASGAGNGFVWLRNKSITFVSCYFSPNVSIAEYQNRMDDLEDSIRDMTTDNLILAGDFNARAVEWGMPVTNTRGRIVLDMAARLRLVVINTGDKTTYRRPGFGESKPDVTLATENLAPRVRDWQVIEVENGSDHEYITYNISDDTARRENRRRITGWNVRKLDDERLMEDINNGLNRIRNERTYPKTKEEALDLTEVTMQLLKNACEASMPRKKIWNSKRSVYWWTEEIAEFRRKCLKHRRLYQRAKDKPEARQRYAEYQLERKKMRDAIKISKRKCMEDLCKEIDNDPWGKAYKIVMGKTGKLAPTMNKEADVMKHIVETLFPTHPELEDRPDTRTVENVPLFTHGDLETAARSLKNGKAPGPDGVPAEIIKIVAAKHPELFLNMYNACLQKGFFPTSWKNARLVLIDKGKGEPNSPSSFRPLCMLDTAGKLYEKLLKARLLQAIQDAGDLSDKQYGFRKGRSTIGAVEEVIKAVNGTRSICHGARPLVLLVTLDVKNAFNSARWKDMLHALEHTFKVPDYLLQVLKSYLKDRTLTYTTTEGDKTKVTTAGAFQGSILGPDLWNIAYDGLLRQEMPEGTFLVGYADDAAVVIVERTVELVQVRLNQVMRRVVSWMENHGLELAMKKTEMVLLTRKEIDTIIPFKVQGEIIWTNEAVKYLGVTLDRKLAFWDHLRQAADKASTRIAALSRIMPNVRGPKPSKRRLLMSTAQSIMLYGAEIWGDEMDVMSKRKRITQVQRTAALRVSCAYRTVSEAAIIVIAGVIPIDLLAKERRQQYLTKQERGTKDSNKEARKRTLDCWQKRWQEQKEGRWTARLIKSVKKWTEREHGEVDFHLTQFLSNHGYFRSYLHRMGKTRTANCKYCGNDKDDAEHSFFVCSRWQNERSTLERKVGKFHPDHIIEKMLLDKERWKVVTEFIHMVLQRKKEDGCLED